MGKFSANGTKRAVRNQFSTEECMSYNQKTGNQFCTLRCQWTHGNLTVHSRGVHGLDFGFLDLDSCCIRQDPDSGFLNKNRIWTGFGFCNLLMKNSL